MGRMTFTVAAVALVVTLPATACVSERSRVAVHDAGVPLERSSGTPAPESPAPRLRPEARPEARPEPEARPRRYAVGLRELRLARGPDRPLRTVLLYPRTAPPAAEAGDPPLRNTRPARGRFPLVLFSHGLHGSPERYTPVAAAWASAGFVVALPAYPHTSAGARPYRRADIVHQPADAAYVIAQVRRLDTRRGDPLRGRIDGDRVAAVGHSAGGYTTTGLFTAGHDARLRAGAVLAGWQAPGAFAGPSATMLFLHGDADPVVPIARGRAAFGRVPWPKSFVRLPGASHGHFLLPGKRGYPQVIALVTDFLRWTLTGDQRAGRRLPPSDLPVPGTMGA
ncbi:alpha/beta hydrolase family protein [Jidongwangia harbinensis]|uniref:alpha/beta hydrolase family protein n=1 Tax=Jidongwangia harbinensis TaxID=2878561 RepID=UPI001CD92D47|nr:alpha/beta hydrolase [Jidongwangia harbinensis]MCA2213437.1 alpha/beta hydrolase [Jidongwangia harbinensis]